ncbi:MAG TPA: secretin N-terminal domain-containing protein [Planctomycetota bacterium]|nr:secretin N-terminal domain-containing protein [Planctomycetota bacterium]
MTLATALAALLPLAFGPAPLSPASPLLQRGRANPGAQAQEGQDPAAAAAQDQSQAQPQAPSRAAAPAAGAAQGETPFVQELGDYIVISVDETGTDSINLEWLTKVCELYTGIVFTYDDATSSALQNAKVRLIGTKRVPKAEIYSFYQILMFIHGFILTRVGPEPLAIVLVQPVQPTPGKANNVRNESVYLTPEELEQYSSQVATQVVTVLHLPHTDVRQLGNSLRGLTTDPTGAQNVVPVGNTNSVILTGFASSVASLARILKLVDAESARDTDISPVFEVIPLEWAAAEDMADILEQLLEAARRNVQGSRQQIQAQGATGQIAGQGGETKILTYPRTNSLLVMALPDDMRNIRELVARLDVDVPEPERTYHVYALENVAAADLADVLEEFIQGANRVAGAGARGGGGNVQPGGSPGTGLSSRDSEIVVVADEATNSLLVAASKRRYEEVAELIQKLDQRQDQVLIETALIELTGRTGLDLGVELGLADIPSDGTGGFGISSFGLSTFADTNGDGLPDQRVPNDSLLGLTGGIIDAGDFSLPVLINALATRRDTNVLSKPSLLVNNNGSATVESLDSSPTQTVTQAAAGGNQAGFGGFEDAGVTLTISPSISASGYLRLNISLVISTFTGSSSNPALPPPKTTRTISTTVNVPDGDTMVIGGIITEADTKDNSRIPWLGDIPLLGRLFRRDSDSTTRTTLYFFVTPHILEDKNFADLAEISYRAKLDAAETIGADRVKVIDPNFMRAGDQVDLSPFELPLYRSPRTGNVSAGEVGLDPDTSIQMIDDARVEGEDGEDEP